MCTYENKMYIGHLGYYGSQEEYVEQIGSIQFADVGTSANEEVQ